MQRTTERAPMDELWIDPGSSRGNLIDGVGARGPKPVADAAYTVIETDTGGFSTTYRVRDARGVEWNVKIGPEAQPEVVSSRIVWALGYHQMPSFFVERWIAVEHGRGRLLGGARFRPRKLPMVSRGTWAWTSNPFVGTRPYQGLIALMVMLNSTDLKTDNNEVYDQREESRGRPARVYVVKDLGATLGESGRLDPRRGYLEGFEHEPFIVSSSGGRLRFGFRGRHQELLQRLTPGDLRWIGERMLRLTDRQLRDAFRAGGYDAEQTRRYVARLREKAREGTTLP